MAEKPRKRQKKIENTDSDLKVHMLYYANELLVRVRFSFQKLLQIVVKFNIPLFYRYFYNHLSNYTKTIIRLRLVNIGEYLTIIPRARMDYESRPHGLLTQRL